MKSQSKEIIYDFLNKVDCLYSEKILSNFEKIEFADSADSNNLQRENFLQTEKTKTLPTEITIDSIAEKIANCTRCNLCKTRKNTVPGMGVKNPLVLVIGEGPGFDEDVSGLPFVGKAGQLLDKMLMSIQLSRDVNCFIANIVKCRPPQNRDPQPDEADACKSFLQAQIQILKPKMILALGRISVQNLLNTKDGINKLRGNFFNYNEIPLLATYHPSALLRNEELKRPAWEDLKKVRTRLLEIDPNYQNAFSSEKN